MKIYTKMRERRVRGVDVVVKEGVHIPILENNMRRVRFFEKLHLLVPTDFIALVAHIRRAKYQ